MDSKQTARPTILKRTCTILGFLALLWAAGFAAFMALILFTPPTDPGKPADVVIVLTGGPGRIEEGFTLMAQSKARAMLITGVHPHVTLARLIDRWQAPPAERQAISDHCCIDIEHKAESTEDNAAEARTWLERKGGVKDTRVRLITSDYHMPRALLLFRRALPEAAITPWPVKSTHIMKAGFFRIVAIEYSKTLLAWLS